MGPHARDRVAQRSGGRLSEREIQFNTVLTRGKGLLLDGKLWPTSEQNMLNTAYRSD